MEPQVYLADGFDPKKLTIPNLRSILVEHEVYFPSNASKLELVEIFNQSIKPRANLLLKKYTVGAKDPEANLSALAGKSVSKDNSYSKDADSSIGSKRQLETQPAPTKKKTKKKLRKMNVNNDFSASFSDNSSFLTMDKFEIDENDNIFNGSIDGKPIELLAKPTYLVAEQPKRAKTPTKKILEHFTSSLPASKSFTMDKNESIDPSVLEDSSQVIANDAENILPSNLFNPKDGGKVQLLDDIFDTPDNHNASLSRSSDGSALPTLKGPTGDIHRSTLIMVSSSDDDSVGEEKLEGVRVATMDVKSLTTLEDSSLISSSDESVVAETAQEKPTLATVSIATPTGDDSVAEYSLEDQWEEIDADSESTNISKESTETAISTMKAETKSDGYFKTMFFKSLDVIMIALPILLMYCVREIDLNTGYCGFESPLTKRLDLWGKIPVCYQEKLAPAQHYVHAFETFMDNGVKLKCKPCPENGICNFSTLTCKPGYVKTTGLDSLFGFFPLRESCEVDTLREEKMRYFSEYTLKYLHQHNDKALSLDELHDYLKMTKASQLSNEKFEEYWNEFVENELEDDEIWTIDPNTQEITLTHKIPSEHFTKTFGNVEQKRSKESRRLFSKSSPNFSKRKPQTKTKE